MKILRFSSQVKKRKITVPLKMHFELNLEIKMHKKSVFLQRTKLE